MQYIQFASDGWFPAIGYESGKVTVSTQVDGGRNVNGDFIGQVVGATKYKYEINFKTMDPAEIQELLRRMDHTIGGSFQNQFLVFDPARNDFVVRTMYVGDRSGRPFKVKDGRPERWLDSQANLIEV